MICSGEQITWAEMISGSLGDGAPNATGIAIWLRNNLSQLNLAIGSDFHLNESGCIVPGFTSTISGIYQEMYYCHYIRKQMMSMVNTMGYYDVSEVTGSEQGTVRTVSRNERLKTLRGLSNDCEARLQNLIDWYNKQFTGPAVGHVITDYRGDTAGNASNYYACSPPCDYYSPYNTIWNGGG